VTPFLLDCACAFETSAGGTWGPWTFSPPEAEMLFHGDVVELCGWREMEALAVGDPAALRWLTSFREDVKHGLLMRTTHGSIYDRQP
jgi:hypothetical protein